MPSRPISPADQYARLKHFLPLTKEPSRRPSPEDLRIGVRLRVEWSSGWWASRIIEEADGRIKVNFTSWSSKYDEWIVKDSSRLRIPDSDDVDPPENEDIRISAGFGSSPSDTGGVPGVPSSLRIAPRIKPFVPKPYNPEKEFLKRQHRLKEKIAAMQKVKLGAVDPAYKDLEATREAAKQAAAGDLPQARPSPQEIVAQATAPVPPPPEPPQTEPLMERVSPKEFPAAAAASAVTAAQMPHAFEAPAAAKYAMPQQKAAIAESETSANQVPPSAVTPPTPTPKVAEDCVAPARGASRDFNSVASNAQQLALPQAAASVVRWHEHLSDQNERYYHDPATGHVQWDLPQEGWVELLADDGSRYYWDPIADKTQWTMPTAHP